jgi:hypothetical protein
MAPYKIKNQREAFLPSRETYQLVPFATHHSFRWTIPLSSLLPSKVAGWMHFAVTNRAICEQWLFII